MKHMTDAERVLEFFRTSGGKWISNAQIMKGDYYGTKPIATYTARITDARDIINCNCGIDETTCTASEHIRNVQKNWYQYVGVAKVATKQKPVGVWVDLNQVESQLIQVRSKLPEANGVDKLLLQAQEKALLRSIELQRGIPTQTNVVMEALS